MQMKNGSKLMKKRKLMNIRIERIAMGDRNDDDDGDNCLFFGVEGNFSMPNQLVMCRVKNDEKLFCLSLQIVLYLHHVVHHRHRHHLHHHRDHHR